MSPIKASPTPFRCCAILFVLTAAGSVTKAADYYLGSTAIAQPGIAVSSIAALNALTLQPGDRVMFQAGEIFTGTICLGPEDAGTPASPVVVTSFGSGRATIAGGAESAIEIYNAAGFAISRLDLTGNGPGANLSAGVDAGVYLPDSTKLPYLRLEQLNISGFKKGVEIWGWYSTTTRTYPGFQDVKVTGVNVSNCLSTGIETWGSRSTNGDGKNFSHANFTIAHCSVSDVHGDPASKQHTGSGILIGGVDGAVVEYCVAHDNGGYGPATGGGPFGIWAWESRSVTLQYNLVYNQRSSSGLDGGAYDLDGGCSNSVVQYNYSYNNQGPALAVIQFSGASPLVNSVLRYNISENDCRKNGQGIIYVGQFSTKYGINGAEIYGNTIFVSANSGGGRPVAAAVQNQALISNVRLRNNIFYATHSGSLIGGVTNNPAKALYQGNAYWGGAFDLTTFRSYGQEKIGTTLVGARVDPQLVNPGRGGAIVDPALLPTLSAYALKSTSPLIDRGLDLTALFGVAPGATDFYGVPIASASLDVGAAAYTVATPPTPPPPAPAPVPPPPAEPPTGVLVDDEFTGSGVLNGRLPDLANFNGSRWSNLVGTTTIASGTAATNTSYRGVVETGASDCTIETSIVLTTCSTGVIVRCTDGANYLRLQLNASSLQLAKTAAGVSTTVSSIAKPFVIGQTYLLRATLCGSTISVSINGTPVANFTSTFNQTGTRHGLLAVNSGVRKWQRFTVAR